MLTKDIYGKELTNNFASAINSYAQAVKPKIKIDLLDSRHLSNVSVTSSIDPGPIVSSARNYFFTEKQAVNGFERQAAKWAVTDALDIDGEVIRSDGTWLAMPSPQYTVPTNAEYNHENEYGYWTTIKSDVDGNFTSAGSGVVLEYSFDERPINKFKFVTSEFNGGIKDFKIVIRNSTSGIIFNEEFTMEKGEYFKEFYILTHDAKLVNFMASTIQVTIFSTHNPYDYGRIQEICPIYEVDLTDYLTTYSVSRTRDLHESNLPIGGSQSSKVTISLDNTSKDWNIFNSSSLYGKYMVKDLKIKVGTGWRIIKTDEISIDTLLAEFLGSSSMAMTVDNTDLIPPGGTGNYFLLTIDGDNDLREVILCNSKSGTRDIIIEERGYARTKAVAHTKGATVSFDPYEYVPMGEFFVEEWSASSDSMTVTVQASDWSKYLLDTTLSKGFLIENATVGDAVRDLVSRVNFPAADFKQVEPYITGSLKHKPNFLYSFNESITGVYGSEHISDGLRLRLWAFPAGQYYNVKSIYSDSIERTLSPVDRQLGLKPIVSPNYTGTSHFDSGNAVWLNDFSFTGTDGITYDNYFNGIADGYYIPTYSGNQKLKVKVKQGGARLYIDDNLVATSWKLNTSLTTLSSDFLNLKAGVPYKIKIEFFHGASQDDFNLKLYTEYESYAERLVYVTETTVGVVNDYIGINNAPFDMAYDNANHNRNNAVYAWSVETSSKGGVVSDLNDKCAYLNGGWVRIPVDSGSALTNLSDDDFTYEILIQFSSGHSFGDGPYISSWGADTPSDGFEFYYSAEGEHGFKVVTSHGVEYVNPNLIPTDITDTDWTYIVLTYKSDTKTLNYYIDGKLIGTKVLIGSILNQTFDTTIGGRGSYFAEGDGEQQPLIFAPLKIGKYIKYSKTLSSDDVIDRYISKSVQPITIYPYLYGDKQTIRSAIDSVTLADFGRFYIDEQNYGRYEHYNRFYESSIDQHANIQYNISDNSNIISADLNIQLQVNRITVKVAGISSAIMGTQPLWRAPSPTTLAVVSLDNGLTISEADTMRVTTTTDPPFSNIGYLMLGSEIIRYNSKTDYTFNDLTRGIFDTDAADHTTGAKVKEARYFEIVYDKSPAFAIKTPYISEIVDEKIDKINILKFDPGPYTANLLIAASEAVNSGDFVFAEGKDSFTEIEYFTSIAGTPIFIQENQIQVQDQVVKIDENIRKYGLKEITIDSPYITDVQHAHKIAKFIIDKMGDPVPVLNVTIMAIPTIQLGDRISITTMDNFDIINAEYWVISQEFSYGATLSHSFVLRKVS